jgi:beta-glucosidase/6-phospho-beta-glucosidase/beta-galactosidase
MRAMVWSRRKDDYARFVDAFAKRYKDELKYVGLMPEIEMLRLYFEFKGSGKTPEQWLDEQELS